MERPITSPGSTPKPNGVDSVRVDRAKLRASIAFASALVGWTVFWHIGAAAADLKLLPPEEAFKFAARALDTRTLEATFTIADGYYLYRDKLRFSSDGGVTLAESPTLPPGKVKDDEFFGRVETYRDRVVVKLPLRDAAPSRSITLVSESQGCADAGVCYPPVSQRVTIPMPALDGRPGALIEAAPPKKRWFN